ncbi:hypothetical protein CR513_61081, partial [Mucuna pruriens]
MNFLHLVKRDTQSVNAKVEALTRKNEENRQPSMQESEASHKESHVNGGLSPPSYKGGVSTKSTSRKSYPNDNGRGKERGSLRKDKSPKKKSETPKGRKEEEVTPPPSPSRSSSIKCFKCLGKGHIAS